MKIFCNRVVSSIASLFLLIFACTTSWAGLKQVDPDITIETPSVDFGLVASTSSIGILEQVGPALFGSSGQGSDFHFASLCEESLWELDVICGGIGYGCSLCRGGLIEDTVVVIEIDVLISGIMQKITVPDNFDPLDTVGVSYYDDFCSDVVVIADALLLPGAERLDLDSQVIISSTDTLYGSTCDGSDWTSFSNLFRLSALCPDLLPQPDNGCGMSNLVFARIQDAERSVSSKSNLRIGVLGPFRRQQRLIANTKNPKGGQCHSLWHWTPEKYDLRSRPEVNRVMSAIV